MRAKVLQKWLRTNNLQTRLAEHLGIPHNEIRVMNCKNGDLEIELKESRHLSKMQKELEEFWGFKEAYDTDKVTITTWRFLK